MNINIRKANKDEYEVLGEVHYESWYDTYKDKMCDDFLSYNNISKLVNDFIPKISNTIVVEVDKKIVGFLYYRKIDKVGLEVHELYILKEFQGQGLGKKLINYLLELNKNISDVILWVLEKNEPAIYFYKKYGFHDNYKREYIEVSSGVKYTVLCYEMNNPFQ
ncbi:GNAT family N-acetyltransferase [Mycoplasmatota bacterium]|nr:GNAT family N-acetyltransferase [Mycoplasmatota bacterium]